MQQKLSDIAKIVGGKIHGDSSVLITGLSGIKEAKAGDLTFLANAKYFSLLETTQASAVIVPLGTTGTGGTSGTGGTNRSLTSTIESDNPSLAFAKIASVIFKDQGQALQGIHPTAIIGKDVKFGKNVAIGPYVVLGNGVVLGDNTVVHGLCFIGHQTKIGKDCLIYPNVTIRERILLGERVIIHSGSVIGSDGFGFVNVKGINVKIPQIGMVEISDDVEIGANVTIDRARFDKTVIGKGTKIDNLVQIAHNVRIGENCIIVSQVGISGSTVLEDNVTLAGQAGLVGHITIGKNSIVAAQSGVPKSVPPDTVVWGFPAKPINEAKRVNAALQRLPHYVQVIGDFKKRIEELEAQLKKAAKNV